MSCKFEYKGKEYTEKELISKLASEPEVISKYVGSTTKKTYRAESKTIFEKKIQRLQEAMDVKVILDDTVQNSVTLGKGDKRVKEYGKPVILINPNKIFRETAIHEFGHIFIDSLPGGIDNPRIQKAYKQLQGTELESEVKELYPELSDEMFIKELITTAIGREGADIWDNESDMSTWQRFKDWLFSFIRRTFSLNDNQIESMAKEMLSGLEITRDLTTGLPMENQYLREKEDRSEESSKINYLERTYNDLLTRIANTYNEYTPKTEEERIREGKRSAKGTTRFETVSELKDQLEKLNKVDQILGLSKYIEWVNSELNVMKSKFNERKANGSLNNKKIIASMRWNNAFDLVDDIQRLSLRLEKDGILSEEDKVYYDKMLSDIQQKRSDMSSILLQSARESYAEFISENDNQIKNRYKKSFEKEFDDLGLESSGQNKYDYVRSKMLENADLIKEEAYNEALNASERSYGDISSFAGRFFSEKNIDSKDIQILSKVVDNADLKIKNFASALSKVFDENNKNYKKDFSDDLNQEKKYKKMISKSESGKHYFASQYKPEFIEEKTKLTVEMSDSKIYLEKYKDFEIDKNLKYKTAEGKTKRLQIFGASNIRHTPGEMHVTFYIGGEKYTISKEEAIARSEFTTWVQSNTEAIMVNGQKKWVPKQKWINKDYNSLSQEEKDQLNWFKKKIKEADLLTKGKSSLITNSYNQEWIALPSVLKTSVQRALQGNIKDVLKYQKSKATEKQKDDYETLENESSKNSIKFLADIANQEKKDVPVPFRSDIKGIDQSLDLHTIVLLNSVAAKEYSEKKSLEATFLLVAEVMKERKNQDIHGVSRLKKIHAMSPEDAEVALYKNPKDGLPEDAKKAMDIIENRIWNIKNKDAGEILGANVQQLTRSWLKYSGVTALVGNIANSIVNYNMGSINNFIEAMGGEFFTRKDLMVAKKKYWKDGKDIMNDIGSNVDVSRTNLFMNIFNVRGGEQYLDNKFEEGSKLQALVKLNTLRPLANMGEHMMQAQLMYAIMNNIKVMNKAGKFINKEGKVVSSKEEAASIDEMITFKKVGDEAKMILDSRVGSTTFTTGEGQTQVSPQKILLETRNIIKNKTLALHGNYDQEIQAAAQREFWGKLLFFLRKWTLPGIQRRFRGFKGAFTKSEDLKEADRFYSQDLKSYMEGYYITGFRFITRTLFPAVKELNFALIKQDLNKMTGTEIANIKKITTELAMIALTWLAYEALTDDEDEDENIMARYLLRRQISELSFYLSPPEAVKIASTPTASVGTLKRIFQFMSQAFSPTEVYEQGSNKGRSKLWVKFLRATPGTSQTERNLKDSLKFLNQMSF